MLVFNIAQQIFRLDKVVTGVEIAVMLKCQGIATCLRKNAQRWWCSIPGSQCRIEHLHKDGADIMPHPLIENGDQKCTPLLWLHRALGDLVPLLKADLSLLIDALNNRDKLYEVRADFIAQEAVHLQGVIGIGGVDGRQD